MDTLTHLKDKAGQLEKRIEETKKRLPAHSVKPPLMMELLALEDEYQATLDEIASFMKNLGTRVCPLPSGEHHKKTDLIPTSIPDGSKH